MLSREKDNWFDDEYGEKIKNASAKEALRIVANDRKVLAAVEDALRRRDTDAKGHGYSGPTRSQVVRTAIAEVLNEDS